MVCKASVEERVDEPMTAQRRWAPLPLMTCIAALALAGCSTRYQEGPCSTTPAAEVSGDWSLAKEVCFRYPESPLFGTRQKTYTQPDSTQLWIKPSSLARSGTGFSIAFLQRAVFDRRSDRFKVEPIREKIAKINCKDKTFMDQNGSWTPIADWKRPDERIFIGGETVIRKSPLNPYKYLSSTYCKF